VPIVACIMLTYRGDIQLRSNRRVVLARLDSRLASLIIMTS
jgi:hypothetical protein